MKSGAYIFLDRIGLYYKELSFCENYGFNITEVKWISFIINIKSIK